MISAASSSSSSSCSHTLLFPAASSAAGSRRSRASFTACRSSPDGTPRTATLLPHPAVTRRCECFDLHQRIVPYVDSWSWQRSIVTRRKLLIDREEDLSDTLVALQHPPVYTLGTDSREDYLHFKVEDAPFDVHRIDRGGEVTYHGPGQLVLYPILNLRYHKMDLHWYLRSLEEVIIRALSSTFSISASRIEGLTGVWVGNQKVAAIGIRVSRWITYHGLALNVTTDLTPFRHIIPCGIRDHGIGSIKELLGKMSDGGEIDNASLIDIAYQSLMKEFTEVFQLSLDFRPDWFLQENNQFS